MDDSRILKLYHVSADSVRDFGDYDTFSEFVIAAYSEEDARNTHPLTGFREWPFGLSGWVRFEQIGELDVKCIGIASPGVKEGIIVSSFQSG